MPTTVDDSGIPPAAGTLPGQRAGRGGPRRHLRWAVPLTLLAVAFVGYALPPYLTLDPSRSRLPVPDTGWLGSADSPSIGGG